MKTAVAGARAAAVGLAVLGVAAGIRATGSPTWWGVRGVLVAEATRTNDYAGANQGQVKWIASNACAELEAVLPGGAGTGVWGLVASFAGTNDFAAVNVGQLKAVARPFYDRLIEIGWTNAYPWVGAPATNDYALANIGQVKNLFGFEPLRFDLDRDGLPDGWERQYGLTVGLETNGLIVFYRLDETAGTAVCDSGGNGLDGIVTNSSAPQWRSGMIRGALGFDGTNGVAVPDDPLLDIATSITLAAYVWLDRTDGVRPIVSKAPGYGLGTAEGAPLLSWSPSMSCRAAVTLATGRWSHVAATYDGTDVVFYVDGLCVGVSNRTGVCEANTNALGLGWSAGMGEESSRLAGRLDDVRVYDRALGSNEVAELAFLAMDSDGDGVGNLDEAFYWTDPTNATSHPHAIFGSVAYTGGQAGAIVVLATTNADSWTRVASTALAGPGGYVIDSLAADTMWWVKAFRDSNGNGVRNTEEAFGVWAGNPTQVLAFARNVDIQMTDPDLDQDGLADWWERLHPTVSITGAVSYAGPQTGPIRVGALALPASGAPVAVTVTIAEPGPYALAGLPRHTYDGQYVVWAFRDASVPSDGVCSSWEATGQVVLVPDRVIVTGTNVAITIADSLGDADTDSDGMPDWWELAHGFDPGEPGDAVNDPDGDRYPNVYEYKHGTEPLDAGDKPVATAVATNGVGSIQGALDGVTNDYAVVRVEPGVYQESGLTFSGKRLLLVAEHGGGEAIVDAGASGPGILLDGGETLASVVCGLTVSNGSSGGIVVSSSSATFRDCVIRQNVGQGDSTAGGASCLGAATGRFVNCAFLANTGACAGAVYADATSAVLLVNCTITRNSADPQNGCAVYGDAAVLRNCVAWNNGSGGVYAASVEYSDIEGGAAGTGNIDQNPLLVAGGWRLRTGSPCIDVGASDAMAACDLDGEVRSTVPDMGADECVDADMDGMGDAWELLQGFDPGVPEDALDDPDGDRYPSVYEYVHGSDPRSPVSKPQATVVVVNGVDTIQGALDGATNDYAIVLVEPGVYHECNVSLSGKRLLLVAEPGCGDAIIDADASGAGLLFDDGETPASVVCGLTVRNGSSGGIAISSASATFRDCVIRGNVAAASYAGGVTCFSAGPVRFVNCAIIGNHGEPGNGAGAVYADAASAVFINCTIAWNSAPSWGAALWTGLLQLRNCIVWSNSPCALWASPLPVESTILEGGPYGLGETSIDPLLVRNGWRIRTDSPCRDAGADCTASVLDLEGEPRTSPWDMGADEFVDTDQDGMADAWEFLAFGNLDAVGGGDPDTDGLSNLLEYENGTDPLNGDTDGDGYTDAQESQWGSDPCSAQSIPHVVAGTVSYAGPQSGPITVLAVTDAGSWDASFSVTIPEPGAYAIIGLPPDTSFAIKAFRDSNENGLRDDGEAYGAWSGNPTQPIPVTTDVDFALTDPDEDSDGMVDWWEIAQGFNCHDATDATDDPDGDRYPNVYEYVHGTSPWDAGDSPESTVTVPTDMGTIQEAIGSLVDDYAVVRVEPGVYQEHDVSFGGRRLLLVAEAGAEAAVIDAGASGAGVVFASGETPASVVCGLTIRNASAGGVVASSASSATFRDCVIRNNAAPGDYAGGAVSGTDAGVLRFVNCALIANAGGYAGAACALGAASVSFINCTIAGNTAAASGAALWVNALEMRNCIVWSNSPCAVWVSSYAIDYSDIEGGAPGYGNISYEPSLVRNGWRLRTGSPCLNAGADYMASLYDLEGEPRTSPWDMGADEFVDGDWDGMGDGWECGAFGDTAQPPDGDMDGDGLLNLYEYENGLDPISTDTDGDLVDDGVECQWGSDPLDPFSVPHVVTGAVSYTGPQSGPIVVLAVVDPESWDPSLSVSIGESGTYAITGIPPDTSLTVKAFRDSNQSGSRDDGEAYGVWPGSPTQPIPVTTNVDITLADPDEDADGMIDWWEVLEGFNCHDSTDAVGDSDGDRYPNLYEYAHATDPWNAASKPSATVVVANGVDTIQGALEGVATDYAIVRVEPGVYEEHDLNFLGKRLLLVAEAGAGDAVVDAGGAGTGFIFTNGESQASVVCGLAIRNGVVGGVAVSNAGPTFRDCVIERNLDIGRTNGAGAVSCLGVGTSLFVNCAFVGNEGAGFGAVHVPSPASAALVNCTIAWNTAQDATGAVVRGDGVQMLNCIVWSNSPALVSAGFVEWSDVDGGATGTGNTNAAPLLVRNSWRLKSGSPCSDAGTIMSASLYDIEGELRSSPPDMGADEFVDTDADGMGDAWELQVFGNLDTLGGDDADADGLSSLYEYENGLCPTNSDTDGDGALDGVECEWGYDPLDPQSVPHIVAGTVSYAGPQSGPIVVLAVADPWSWATNASVSMSETGSYVIAGIPPFTNCTIKAFRDSNTNGAWEGGEVYGEWLGNPTQPIAVTTNVDIELSDSDTDADGMPDWWERHSGLTVGLVTNGLVAYYRFDETSGVVVADSGGKGLDGVIANCPTQLWRSGMVYGALEFDGTHGGVVVQDDDRLDLTTNLTLAAYVWRDGGGSCSLLSKFPGYNLRMSDQGRPYLVWLRSGAAPMTCWTDMALPTGQWVHVATTYDGSNVAFYVDGICVGVSNRTGVGVVNTNALGIGWKADDEPRMRLDGRLDDVRIYGRALAGNEVAELAVLVMDPDGDGVANSDEARWWTDPTNAASHPHAIFGAVAYTGGQAGAIEVMVTTNADSWTPGAGTTIVEPGAYALEGLPSDTTWWVKAFRDSNANRTRDADEACGDWPGSPTQILAYAHGIDLALTDPDRDSDGLADWWETLHPTVSITGAVVYSGRQTGPVRVGAMALDANGNPVQSLVTLDAPGSYALSGLPRHPYDGQYVLWAYVDSSEPEHGQCSSWEATGQVVLVPEHVIAIGAPANIELADPDTDSDAMPDWWELLYGLNPEWADDAVDDADGDRYMNVYEYQHASDPTALQSCPTNWLSVPGDYATIQDAVNAVTSDYGIVRVSPGTYSGPGNVNIVAGQWKTLIIAESNAWRTVIDCENNSFGFLFVGYFIGVDSHTSLNGFTVRNGSADWGGAIRCSYASPTIENCILERNAALYEGGGIWCGGGGCAPIIRNCIISENVAGLSGGGVWYGVANDPSSPWIDHCTIVSNRALAAAGSPGGGVACTAYGYGALVNSIVYGNAPDQVAGTPAWIGYSDVQGSGGYCDLDPALIPGTCRLTAWSPCRGLGYWTRAAFDIDGELRPQLAGDLGADQYGDNDSDSMADAWELLMFGDLSHSGDVDADNDGLTDWDEYISGCSAVIADTDGDGVCDAWEVSGGTKPYMPGDSQLDAWVQEMDGESATILIGNAYGFTHRFAVDGGNTWEGVVDAPVSVSGTAGMPYTLHVTRLGGSTTSTVDVSWRLRSECRASLLFRRSPPVPSPSLATREFGSTNVILAGMRSHWDRFYLAGDVTDLVRWELPGTTLLRLQVPGYEPIEYAASGAGNECLDITDQFYGQSNVIITAIDNPGGLGGFTNDVYLIRWEPQLRIASP